MGTLTPEASGPEASHPPSPSTFSEAHFCSLRPQHRHNLGQSLAHFHLDFRSHLCSHFLQEAFSDHLGNLWYLCPPSSTDVSIVKLLDHLLPWDCGL